jgi:hypothetical protein
MMIQSRISVLNHRIHPEKNEGEKKKRGLK